MPAVWASAPETVSAVVDAATPKAATFPKRERILRREIACDLMISLMIKTPRRFRSDSRAFSRGCAGIALDVQKDGDVSSAHDVAFSALTTPAMVTGVVG